MLADLVALPLPAERYPHRPLPPEQQRQRTLEVLLALVGGLAEQQPVLVLVEDLQWVDPSTRELLGLLIDQVPTTCIYTVVTSRPALQAPWGFRAHLTPLALNRLTPSQAEAMVEAMRGEQRLPVAVLAQIVAQTDGIPLFVEEVTKAVLEAGRSSDGQTLDVASGPVPALAIPATLHEALLARLDRLGSAKGVAQLGATLGREFPYALLQAVSPWDEETVQRGLHQLVAAELLYQRGLPPLATYRFKHTLIQEAAYQSLLKRTRQRHHRQSAQVLEAQFPDTAETRPALLAYHYTAAGCREHAVGYWHRAGVRALQRSANPEAVQHLTTGLDLLATLPETPARAQQELDLQIALGPALSVTQGMAAPAVEQTYARARALCAQVGETPQRFQTLRGLSRFYQSRGALQTARELAEQLSRLAQRGAAPTPRLEAHDALGSTLFFLGDYAAAWTHLAQGIALTDAATQPALALHIGEAPGVRCLTYAALTLWCLGYPAQALRRSQEALALAQALPHPHSLAHAQHFAAFLHHHRREAPASLARAEALLTLATAQGFPHYVGFGTCWWGGALAMQGQGEVGLAQMRQGMAAVLATGQGLARPLCLVLLAEAAGHAGQVTEGLRLLAETLRALEASGRGDLLAEAYRLQGACLLRHAVPATAQAEACFQQALTIARHQQAKSWELRAATSLAWLWQQQGKRAEARDLLGPIYGWFTEGFDTADLQEAKALLEALA